MISHSSGLLRFNANRVECCSLGSEHSSLPVNECACARIEKIKIKTEKEKDRQTINQSNDLLSIK